MRNVIVHYHLYKNAGTSVDRLLENNFGERWTEFEGSGKPWLMPAELGEYLLDNPQLLAVSSHNAQLPVPKLRGVRVFPILFIRNPIDRIRSVYEFERRQDADTEGARNAKALSFMGYLEWRRSHPHDVSTRNFQTWRLAQGTKHAFGDVHKDLLNRALKTIASIPLIGLVEDFGLSVRYVEQVLRAYFPDLRFSEVRANVTQASDSDLGSRIEAVRIQLGDDEFKKLVLENALDMQVHETIHARLTAIASTLAR